MARTHSGRGAAVGGLLVALGAATTLQAAEPVFLTSVARTLYRVRDGGVETFPNMTGATTGMTTVPPGVAFAGCRAGDIIGVEPGAGGRIWRVDNARLGTPVLVEVGRMPAGVGATSITFAHGRFFSFSGSHQLRELNPLTFAQIGSTVNLTSTNALIGSFAFDGDASWYFLSADSNRLFRCDDPPSQATYAALGPSGVDLDSSGLEFFGTQLWGAIRTPGNTSGTLVIGEFNVSTGQFTRRWDVVRVATNNNVNVALAAFRRTCACPADVDDGSRSGRCDGGITIEDLIYYLGIFQDGVLEADLDDGSGSGEIDGGVTIGDLLYFLDRFTNGC